VNATVPAVRPAPPLERAIPRTSDVVTVDHAGKQFDKEPVLEDIDLRVGRGELFGLIGPSGCGKTTLVRLLMGLLKPTAGNVVVLGKHPAEFAPKDRERMGYAPQQFFLYPTLSLQGNAHFVAQLYGMGWRHRRRRTRELLELLGLWETRHRRAGSASGGMQRRLLLACALLHEPELLIVDEPTAGLDPAMRLRIWEHIQSLRSRGVTIFLTTQYLEEATYCDRVAVMRAGRLIAQGPPDDLRRQALGGDIVDVHLPNGNGEAVASTLREMPDIRSVQSLDGGILRIVVPDSAEAIPKVTAALHERSFDVKAIEPHNASFDEVFLRLVEH
jgi:ABC-2 type transport system ATP-binding protein